MRSLEYSNMEDGAIDRSMKSRAWGQEIKLAGQWMAKMGELVTEKKEFKFDGRRYC
jgi:hypothetical protein